MYHIYVRVIPGMQGWLNIRKPIHVKKKNPAIEDRSMFLLVTVLVLGILARWTRATQEIFWKGAYPFKLRL